MILINLIVIFVQFQIHLIYNVVNIEEGFGGIQEKTNLPIVTDVLEPEV